jgi:L-methionine (R)-S-oxide reductase
VTTEIAAGAGGIGELPLLLEQAAMSTAGRQARTHRAALGPFGAAAAAVRRIEAVSMSALYHRLERQVRELLSGESDFIANAANFAAFIYHELPDVNWAGFYFADRGGDLVLGPFAGKPACTRLSRGRGVCGRAATSGETLVVDDVSAFADHIACDTASRSEIVVPLKWNGDVAGVFDIDSPLLARFSRADREGVERLVCVFTEAVRLPPPARAR